MQLANLLDSHVFRCRHSLQIFAVVAYRNFFGRRRRQFCLCSGFETLEKLARHLFWLRHDLQVELQQDRRERWYELDETRRWMPFQLGHDASLSCQRCFADVVRESEQKRVRSVGNPVHGTIED